MSSFVKHVFTFLLWVSIAWIMYLVLFGTYSLDGREIAVGDTAYTGNTTQSTAWKGVLWHMALAVEGPISRYYYDFCFLPNVHTSDYVDKALGASPNNSVYSGGNLYSTVTDLRSDSDMYNVSSVSDWSSGWVSATP